jgi:hypothetical protein
MGMTAGAARQILSNVFLNDMVMISVTVRRQLTVMTIHSVIAPEMSLQKTIYGAPSVSFSLTPPLFLPADPLLSEMTFAESSSRGPIRSHPQYFRDSP